MSKHHYVYKSFEEEGREYIGVRSCNCLPEEDTKYFGSFRDKSFNPAGKTILFVCETREEAMEIEIELHDFFDVAVNPQFANRSKQTSTKFDTTGLQSGENHPQFGVPHTEAYKKAQSERMTGKYTGENNPMFGVPRTKEWKKAHSKRMSGEKNPNYGNTGALHPGSKAIKVIRADGTERRYGSCIEAARELEITRSRLCGYLQNVNSPIRGKFKGWQFIYQNP